MNGYLLTASMAAAVMLHLRPPPILGNIHCDSLRDCSAATRAFTAVIRRQFPIGSNQDAIESELLKQGFNHLPASIKNCRMPFETPPIGVTVIDCPSWDSNWNPRHQLEYGFTGPLPVCGRNATVRWSSDSRGKITHIEAHYDVTCL